MAIASGQRLTALLLLVSLLLVPISPLLRAQSGSPSEVCQCCRRKDHKDCRMSHPPPTGGPSWDAAPDCGSGCRQQPATVVSILLSLEPQAAGAPRLRPRIVAFDLARHSHQANISPFAWRYQRPPPLP